MTRIQYALAATAGVCWVLAAVVFTAGDEHHGLALSGGGFTAVVALFACVISRKIDTHDSRVNPAYAELAQLTTDLRSMIELQIQHLEEDRRGLRELLDRLQQDKPEPAETLHDAPSGPQPTRPQGYGPPHMHPFH